MEWLRVLLDTYLFFLPWLGFAVGLALLFAGIGTGHRTPRLKVAALIVLAVSLAALLIQLQPVR